MVDGKKPQKITSFEQLTAWQESQNLAVMVYKLTKSFPKEETFGLSSQLRRAVSSISANIAEGFGRPSINDKSHFLAIAYGSLLETKNFLYLAKRLDYLDDNLLRQLLEQCTSCQKLINAFKKSLKQ